MDCSLVRGENSGVPLLLYCWFIEEVVAMSTGSGLQDSSPCRPDKTEATIEWDLRGNVLPPQIFAHQVTTETSIVFLPGCEYCCHWCACLDHNLCTVLESLLPIRTPWPTQGVCFFSSTGNTEVLFSRPWKLSRVFGHSFRKFGHFIIVDW